MCSFANALMRARGTTARERKRFYEQYQQHSGRNIEFSLWAAARSVRNSLAKSRSRILKRR